MSFCFQRIRPVALIELRDNFNRLPDRSLNFYLDRMNSSVYENHISLRRFERLRKISKEYAIYDIHYSNSPNSNGLDTLFLEYDYILISRSESIVKDFHLAKREFEQKCKSPSYCRISDLEDMLDIYKSYLQVFEYGELEMTLLQKVNFKDFFEI